MTGSKKPKIMLIDRNQSEQHCKMAPICLEDDRSHTCSYDDIISIIKSESLCNNQPNTWTTSKKPNTHTFKRVYQVEIMKINMMPMSTSLTHISKLYNKKSALPKLESINILSGHTQKLIFDRINNAYKTKTAEVGARVCKNHKH